MNEELEHTMVGSWPLIHFIAYICHEANRALVTVTVGLPRPQWCDLPQTTKECVIAAVREVISSGYCYGADVEAPERLGSVVGYEKLSFPDRLGGHMFRAIVLSIVECVRKQRALGLDSAGWCERLRIISGKREEKEQ